MQISTREARITDLLANVLLEADKTTGFQCMIISYFANKLYINLSTW